MNNVVIIGNLNSEMVMPAPFDLYYGGNFSRKNLHIAGGSKGAKQALAAAQAANSECTVYLIACVTEDQFGESVCSRFARMGIATDYILKKEGISSGATLRFLSDSEKNRSGMSVKTSTHLSLFYIKKVKKAIIESDYLLTQLENPIEAIQYAFTIAKINGTKIILNPSPARQLTANILRMVDIITLNQSETEFYAGIFPVDVLSAIEATKKMHSLGINTVVISMSECGVLYSCESELTIHFIPSQKVAYNDLGVSEDTFIGSFVAALAGDMPTLEALTFATRVATSADTKSVINEYTQIYQ